MVAGERWHDTSSDVSDISICSDYGLSSVDVSSAEEVVMNARRKVSILLAIFTQLQPKARGHISRNPRTIQDIDEPEFATMCK